MNVRHATLLILLILFKMGNTAVAAEKKIQAYFNNYEGDYYTDPYRQIPRRGTDLEALLVQAIEGAQESILVAVQELRLPNVAKALAARKREGIDVRVVLENLYNHTLEEMGGDVDDDTTDTHASSRFSDLFALVDMNRDGQLSRREIARRDAIHILRSNRVPIKDDTSDSSQGTGLMHHKFMVIDQKTLYVGSANYTMSGIHGDVLLHNTTGNANVIVRIESEDVSEYFVEEFYYMWGGKNGRRPTLFGQSKPFRGSLKANVENSEVTTQFSPTSRYRSYEDSVNGLIASELEKANNQIKMALFVFSDQKIGDVLRYQFDQKKEMDLGVLVERRFAYRYYSELLDMWGLQQYDESCRFEENNAPWENTQLHNTGVANTSGGDMLHHKFAVLDGETVIFGSQNWSETANYINDENVLVIKDRELAKQFLEEFNRLDSNSRKGPSASLLRRIEDARSQCEQFGRLTPSIED